MTTQVSTYLKYANLQMAAEALYEFNPNLPGGSSPAGSSGNYPSIPKSYLENGNNRASKFTSVQADEFREDWAVVAHKSNTSTGFSGTLFRALRTDAARGIEEGELVLSFRSTEFVDDAARDNQATNTLEIKEKGWAFGQIADMEAWFQQLSSDPDKLQGKAFSVTGYSLGGHLATAFNLLRQEDGEASRIQSTYTFNGAGVGKIKPGHTVRSVLSVFNSLRSNATSLFTSDLAQSRYDELRTATTSEQLQAAIGRVTADIENQTNMPGGGQQPGIFAELSLLREALGRAKSVVDERNRVADLGALPTAATSIEAIGLNYQLAVLAASKGTEAFSALNVFDPESGANNSIFDERNSAGPITGFYDIYASNWPSAVANSQLHYGQATPIRVEDQPLHRGDYLVRAPLTSLVNWDIKLLVANFRDNDFGDTHSLVLLVDSLSVQDKLAQLDSTWTAAKGKALIDAATNTKGASVLLGQGLAEGDALDKIVTSLAQQLGVSISELKPSLSGNTWHELEGNGSNTGRNAFHAALQTIADSGAFEALAGKVVIKLADKNIATQAKARLGFEEIVALQTLSPFVFAAAGDEGRTALESVWQGQAWGNKYLDWLGDRASLQTGGQATAFSNQWIEDRSAMLNLLRQRNLENRSGILPGNKNLRYYDVESKEDLLIGAGSAQRQQFVFGSGLADTLSGQGFADHLYGEAGADTLDGKGGDDYLEGGSGADIYKVAADSGRDTILDSDGNGSIELAGRTLNGSGELIAEASEGQPYTLWYDASDPSQRVDYRWDTRTDELTITGSGSTVVVKDFQSGELGITAPPAPPPAPAPIPVSRTVQTRMWDDPGNDLLISTSDATLRLNYMSGRDLIVFDGAFNASVLTQGLSSSSVEGGREIRGGSGNDILATNTMFYRYPTGAGGATQVVWGQDSGEDTIMGNAGSDFLAGGNRSDRLFGGMDADFLLGGRGADYLEGGDGDDVLFASHEFLHWTEAHNTISFLDGAAPSSYQDVLAHWYTTEVAPGYPVIVRGGSADSPWRVGVSGDAETGRHYLFENLTIADTNNVAPAFMEPEWESQGRRWSDIVDANAPPEGTSGDRLVGGAGDDVLYGSNATDHLFGDDGVDWLYGRGGTDYLFGGAGNDRLQGDGTEEGSLETALVPELGTTFEETRYFDQMPEGLSAADYLFGEAGNDQLLGGRGDDLLDGGDGADTLLGDQGADELYGGAQDDFLSGDSEAGTTEVEGVGGNDRLHGDAGADTLVGGAGSDLLMGGADNDSLIGGTGADTLEGDDGNDQLFGGDDADSLVGGAGNDALNGGTGADTLDGGAGVDGLIGGEGIDVLYVGAEDVADGGEGDDVYHVHGPGSISDKRGNNTYWIAAGSTPQEEIGGQQVTRAVTLSIGNQDSVILEGADLSGSLPNGQPNPGLPSLAWEVLRGQTTAVPVLQVGGLTFVLPEIAQSKQATFGDGVHSFTVQQIAASSGFVFEPEPEPDSEDGPDLTLSDDDDRLVVQEPGKSLDPGGGNNLVLVRAADVTVRLHREPGKPLGTNRIEFQDPGVQTRASAFLDLGPGAALDGASLSAFALKEQGLVEATLHWSVDAGGSTEQRSVVIAWYGVQPDAAQELTRRVTLRSGSVQTPLADLLSAGVQINGSSYADHIAGTSAQDSLNGSASSDTLEGAAGGDMLMGGGGDDLLIGGAGDDTMDGGAGTNTAIDGQGADRYVLRSGSSLLADFGESDDGGNVLQFADASPAEVEWVQQGSDLTVAVRGQAVAVLRGVDAYRLPFSSVEFANGSAWDRQALALHVYGSTGSAGGSGVVRGTDEDDTIRTSPSADTVFGGMGDDFISSGSGGDVLDGEEGDDILDAGDGDDLIVTRSGVDTAIGGLGRDIYVVGDGATVRVRDSSSEVNVLRFDGVTDFSDLVVRRRLNALELSIPDAGTFVIEGFGGDPEGFGQWRLEAGAGGGLSSALAAYLSPEVLPAIGSYQSYRLAAESEIDRQLRVINNNRAFGFELSSIQATAQTLAALQQAHPSMTSTESEAERQTIWLTGYRTAYETRLKQVPVSVTRGVSGPRLVTTLPAPVGLDGYSAPIPDGGYYAFLDPYEVMVLRNGLPVKETRYKSIGIYEYAHSTFTETVMQTVAERVEVAIPYDYSVTVVTTRMDYTFNEWTVNGSADADVLEIGSREAWAGIGRMAGEEGDDLLVANSPAGIDLPGKLAGYDHVGAPPIGMFLDGGVGNDTLLGSNSGDVLVGGGGADQLLGGGGGDIYMVTAGDQIVDLGLNAPDSPDMVVLPESIQLSDLSAAWIDWAPEAGAESSVKALRLEWAPGQGITLVQPDFAGRFGSHGRSTSRLPSIPPVEGGQRQYGWDWWQAYVSMVDGAQYSASVGIEQVRVGDATLSLSQLLASLQVSGTPPLPMVENENLWGGAGADVLIGGNGADVLHGGAGDDLLIGDQLVATGIFEDLQLRGWSFATGSLGGPGDVFDGGAGNDAGWLTAGSDTIRFNLGDGVDTYATWETEAFVARYAPVGSLGERAISSPSAVGAADVIVLGDGLEVSDLWIDTEPFSDSGTIRDSHDVTLRFSGTEDSLRFRYGSKLKLNVVDADGAALNIRGDGNGTSENDILLGTGKIGGTGGADTLTGLAGSDVYDISLNGGTDTVLEAPGDSGTDTLRFGDGILDRDVLVHRKGEDLVLSYVDGRHSSDPWGGQAVAGKASGQVTLIQAYAQTGTVERVEFANGTVWSEQDLLERVLPAPQLAPIEDFDAYWEKDFSQKIVDLAALGRKDFKFNLSVVGEATHLPDWLSFDAETATITGFPPQQSADLVLRLSATDLVGNSVDTIFTMRLGELPPSERMGTVGDDELWGDTASDRMYGLAGNDRLFGLEGNDLLDGGSGVDELRAGSGSDTLDGGAGTEADLLAGEDGSDVYIWGEGSGRDRIEEVRFDGYAVDELQVQGFSPDELQLNYVNREYDYTSARWIRELFLSSKSTSDRLSVNFQGGWDKRGLEFVRFEDGTVWDANYLYDHAQEGVPPENLGLRVNEPLLDEAAVEDSTFEFVVPAETFSGANPTDVLVLSASLANGASLPSWLSFDTTTRTFSGMPQNADVGSLTLKVTATDTAGATASSSFVLTVANTNDAPTVEHVLTAKTATEDTLWSYVVPADTFADVDAADTLAFSATLADGSALPSWLDFNAATRTFSGTPQNGDVGSLTLKVTAADEAGAKTSSSFVLTVANVNDAPTLVQTMPAQTATEDAAWNYVVPAGTFSDMDVGDTLTLSATLADGSALPDWLSFDVTTRTFSGTPHNTDVGELSLKLTATDGAGATVDTTLLLEVLNTNDTPTVSRALGSQNAQAHAAWSFAIPGDTFEDVDAEDTLTLSARLGDGSALPGWLSFDAATRTFSGTPGTGDIGILSVTVSAQDASGASVQSTFGLTVNGVPNTAPAVAQPLTHQAAAEDSSFSYTVPAGTFSDPDAGDTLVLSATLADGSALPNWLSFHAATRTFSGIPSNDDVGSLNLQVTATDAAGAKASSSFVLTIANVNDAPTVAQALASQAATEDAAWRYLVPADTFADVDVDDTLTLGATLANGSVLPSWLSFDAATRTFSGTPQNADVGSLILKVTATDTAGTTASSSFVLTIANVNDAPTVAQALAAQAATEDAAWSYVVPAATFADADAGDTWTLSATLADGNTLPGWLTFNASTRTFSGTPQNGDVGNVDLKITAADGAGASASSNFTLSIANVNDAPTVAAALSSQSANEATVFTYTVPVGTFADVDAGDTLSFSAALANGAALPNWLSFDAATRTFSGTPQSGDIGSLSLRVTATDGAGASASSSFALTVAAVQQGGQTLNGTAGNDTLVGGAGPDSLDGLGGNDRLEGLGGHDTLVSSSGADTLLGGSGDDTVLLSGYDGYYDSIDGGEGYDQILGGSGNDRFLVKTLTGTHGIERIDGGTGDNVLGGGWDYDYFDLTTVELVNISRILGGDGSDTIVGSSGDDTIDGGTGPDDLYGGLGNDAFLFAGFDAYVDGVNGGEGYDQLLGGAGDDWFRLRDLTAGNGIEKVDGGAGTNFLYGQNIDATDIELVNIARILGTDGQDTLIGSVGNDTLEGGGGPDALAGGAGDDTILFGTADAYYDALSGGDGADRALGGAGNDSLRMRHFNSAYGLETIDGGAGVNTILGGWDADVLDFSGTQLVNIARIAAGDSNDQITGSAGNDTLAGEAGADLLRGGLGSDTYQLSRGHGVDAIEENDATAGNTDVAQFGSNIAADQLWFSQSGNDLLVSVIGTGDRFTLKSWYLGDQYHVEQFKSGDGKTLLDSQVQQLVQAMAGFAPPSAGQTTLPANYASTLDPVIAANWQ